MTQDTNDMIEFGLLLVIICVWGSFATFAISMLIGVCIFKLFFDEEL